MPRAGLHSRGCKANISPCVKLYSFNPERAFSHPAPTLLFLLPRARSSTNSSNSRGRLGESSTGRESLGWWNSRKRDNKFPWRQDVSV